MNFLKRSCLVTVLSVLYIVAFAQEPFFCVQKGAELEYLITNAKGKVEGYNIIIVDDITGDFTNGTIYYRTISLDKKREPVVENQPEFKVKSDIVNGELVSNYEDMFNNLKAQGLEVTISGDDVTIPSSLSVGQSLKDGNIVITFKMSPEEAKDAPAMVLAMFEKMTTTMKVTERRVTSEETISTSEGTFSCFVIEEKMEVTSMGKTQISYSKGWYSRGVGSVRQESYNEKHKLTTVMTLSKVK